MKIIDSILGSKSYLFILTDIQITADTAGFTCWFFSFFIRPFLKIKLSFRHCPSLYVVKNEKFPSGNECTTCNVLPYFLWRAFIMTD